MTLNQQPQIVLYETQNPPKPSFTNILKINKVICRTCENPEAGGCQEGRQITYHFNLLFPTHQIGTEPRYEP